METLNIKSLTLEPKLARNGKIYFLVQQQDGLRVCWFKDDWIKIKSAMQGDKGKYPIQIEQRGNETIITKTGPKNTFTLKFSIEEWDELRNLTDRIDSIYNLNKIVFYTWTTEEESAHRSFLSAIDCHLDAAQRGIDMNQLSIHENEIEIPEKTILIKHIFRWILQRQIGLMRKHRCYGCHVEAPGQRDHMDGCLNEDKDYRYEFELIGNKLYIYWTMVYELCMRLQEKLYKLTLNIEMADCCLLFDDAIRNDIQNDIVYSVCCKELICLFEDCFNEM